MRAYAEAGIDAIGVWELKLATSDAEALEQLAASGLGSSSAVPAVPSILPLPLLPEDMVIQLALLDAVQAVPGCTVTEAVT